MPSVSARSETKTSRNAARRFLFNGRPGGTTTVNRRAMDKSLQMLMQMQEKDKQTWEQRSGAPVFSLINMVYSRGCSAGSDDCTRSDNSLYTAARDEEYILGRDWNIGSFAAQEGLQWHW